MTATSMSRVVVPLVAFAAACVMAFVVALQHLRREPPVDSTVATVAPTASTPKMSARDQAPAMEGSQAPAKAAAAPGALTVQRENDEGLPAFDVARIEPTGDAVIAGRASPGATVELLRDGEFHDRAVADGSGQFVMVPPRLPSGTYHLSLRAQEADGKQATSKQTVAVVLDVIPTERPLVAVVTPDKPSVVLSQPAGKSVPGAVIVEAVETEAGGKLHVSGRARPSATVRIYLNDSFIAAVTTSPEGRLAVTINQGVGPGSYRVRLDEMEPNSLAVRARAEVPFNVPDPSVTASVPGLPGASKRTDIAAAQPTEGAGIMASVLPDGGSPATVVVPKIATTTVSRGDNLWRLSRLTYGAGTRYAVIYKANRDQIRDPNRIYPGQIFVLPIQ
jgi:hypothetical protein